MNFATFCNLMNLYHTRKKLRQKLERFPYDSYAPMTLYWVEVMIDKFLQRVNIDELTSHLKRIEDEENKK